VIRGTRDVPNVAVKLCNKNQLSLLPGRPRRRHWAKGDHQGFVVRKNTECLSLQQKSEVSYGCKNGGEFPIEGRILRLGGGELL
jgi:hypothetical protein